MNTAVASDFRPNETGLLWPPLTAKRGMVMKPVPFNLFMEARPLLIRLLILVSVSGMANLLPHSDISRGLGPFVPSSAGLATTNTVEMAQLIIDPVHVEREDIPTAAVRTNRHPATNFQFTRFSKSWIQFQY